MKRGTKRLLCALLSLALVLGLMPGVALTAVAEEPMEPLVSEVQESPDAEPLTDEPSQLRVAPESLAPQSQEPVRYIERNWDNNTGAVIEAERECTSYRVVADSPTTESVNWSDGWHVVQGERVIAGRLSITGEVNLILCDGAKLTAQEGITTTGAKLNIYAQSGDSGVLYAGTTDGTTSTCAPGNAGIGGDVDNSGGIINIHGGFVTAIGGNAFNASQSKYGGAGIGGGCDGSGGTITINGGTVIATSSSGAGIGSGCNGGSYTITINGGTVTAASTSAMGIGGDSGKAVGTVDLGPSVGVLAGESEATAVDVTDTFAQSHDQKWAHTELKYAVTVSGDIKNGTVEVDRGSAFANEAVKITAKAADGYELDTVTVRDKDGNPVEVKGGSFAMPASRVTVSATFLKKAEPTPDPEPLELTGSGHVQTYGEMSAKKSGKGVLIGTTGEARRLEALAASLPEGTDGAMEYRGHLQGAGWTDWTEGGRQCGTVGEARRLEAVQMRLSGKVAEDYSVWYRVHSQSYGWLGWAHDGEVAGTAGLSKRGEAVEVQVLPKSQTPKDYVEKQASYVSAAIANVHVQGTGWTGSKSALEFGTIGQSRRLEAIKLSVPKQPETGGISYEVHAQSKGWMPAATDGALAGTTGQSRRLEAIKVSLTGDMGKDFSVWYRVHSQSYGWLGWTCDGEVAGTTGLAKRAEAIKIQVLPKGQVPDGYDASKPASRTA